VSLVFAPNIRIDCLQSQEKLEKWTFLIQKNVLFFELRLFDPKREYTFD